jgi:segregation and condensation protein B
MDEIRDSEEALEVPAENREATPEPEADEPLPTLSAEEVEAVAEQLSINTGQATSADTSEAEKLAILEAIVYITDEPLGLPQIAAALGEPADVVKRLLDKLTEEYNKPEHGLTIREVAGGYKMGTKAEHHEAVRAFVKNLNPPLKLSLAALETLAVIAYKQPMTAPEIMEIRGVQGAGVLKTLLDRKLITTAGRKTVVGKPILYKTTKEFLVQFGLKDLSELPSLKEFEELRRFAFSDTDEAPIGAEQQPQSQAAEAAAETEPEQVASAVAEAAAEEKSE